MSGEGTYYLLIGMMGVNVGLSLAIYGQSKRTNEVHKLLGETMMHLGTTMSNLLTVIREMGERIEIMEKQLQQHNNDGRVH